MLGSIDSFPDKFHGRFHYQCPHAHIIQGSNKSIQMHKTDAPIYQLGMLEEVSLIKQQTNH